MSENSITRLPNRACSLGLAPCGVCLSLELTNLLKRLSNFIKSYISDIFPSLQNPPIKHIAYINLYNRFCGKSTSETNLLSKTYYVSNILFRNVINLFLFPPVFSSLGHLFIYLHKRGFVQKRNVLFAY